MNFDTPLQSSACSGSPNHTTIYVPVGAMGVPVIETIQRAGK